MRQNSVDLFDEVREPGKVPGIPLRPGSRDGRLIDVALERAAVADEARTWLRTPYQHGARLKAVGVDCAQFLIGVYSSLQLVTAVDVPFYSPNWFLHQGGETLRDMVARFCIPTSTPRAGDIALFRFGRAESHAAIVVDFPRVIHADRHAGIVREDAVGPFDSLSSRLSGFWSLTRWSA